MLLSLHGEDQHPPALALAAYPRCSAAAARRDDGSRVDVDNVGGAALAVEHLLERGRSAIATISGPQDMVAGLDRRAGCEKALLCVGREVSDDLVEMSSGGLPARLVVRGSS